MNSRAVGEDTEIAQDDLIAISAEEVKSVAYRALLAHGATPANADTQSTILLEGDLRDQHSHGLQRLPVLVGRIKAGVLDPAADPELQPVSDSAVRLDGRNSFGPVTAFAAVDHLAKRAVTSGVAVATIHRANHLGILAPYVERLAAHHLIGIAITTSEALVHPWGGARALIGTNPLAIGVPTDNPGAPLVLDMSTSQVSAGKVIHHAARGIALPDGWAIDKHGEPTNDAAAALDGALTPFGGAKGYALGIALELVVASLTGTSLGTDVRGTLDTDSPSTKGDVIIALSPTLLAFGQTDLAAYLGEVRASGRESVVTIPGDRARSTRRARLRDGFALPRGVWNAALELAADSPKKEAR